MSNRAQASNVLADWSIVGGVRTTTTANSDNQHHVGVAVERHREPEPSDPDVPVRAGVQWLAVVGRLLDDDWYLDQARELTQWLVERIAHEDAPTDLLHGKAGALLVLLSIYEQTRSETLLDRAHQVGTALIADAEQSPPKTGWQLDTETGMAHGHAGIAYALYRLAAHSDRSEPFRRAADQAIAHENQYYSPAENRWAATPSDRSPRYAWCNGDVGIGAARAASLRYVESEILRRDV